MEESELSSSMLDAYQELSGSAHIWALFRDDVEDARSFAHGATIAIMSLRLDEDKVRAVATSMQESVEPRLRAEAERRARSIHPR